MDFAVVLFVFAVTSEVFGYPAVFNLDNRISNSISYPGRKYKLPRAIMQKFVIEVNGTLNTEDNTFSVLLPELKGTDSCRIVHSFKNNETRVSPAPPGTTESRSLYIGTLLKEPEFLLTLKANLLDGQQIFEVSFLAVESGIAEDLRCEVHFDKLGSIVFQEGVLRINSILFKFQ